MSNIGGEPVRMGVAGLGRSGWGIHCALFREMPETCQVVAVFDALENRRQEAVAAFGCRAYDQFEAMLADQDVELVVVAMPSHLHAPCVIQALQAGKHVVVEKPMAADRAEADRMIAASQRAKRVLTVFQSARYADFYRVIRDVVKSGVLGDIVEIKVTSAGYGRRWDWQTLQKFGGGTLRNTGSHMLDQILDLVPEGMPRVFCHRRCVLTSGDAEDHVKVVLEFPNGPLADLEITSVCAYGQDPWLIMGKNGTLTGKHNLVRWKYIDLSALPPRPVETTPTFDRGYNTEKLDWIEKSWEPGERGPGLRGYYEDLVAALRGRAPLVVTPESVRRQMVIVDECFRQAPLEQRYK